MKKLMFLIGLLVSGIVLANCPNVRQMGQSYLLHFKYDYWNNPSDCVTFEQTLTNHQEYMRPMKCSFRYGTSNNFWVNYSTFGYFHHYNYVDSGFRVLSGGDYKGNFLLVDVNDKDYLLYDEPKIEKPLPDGTHITITFTTDSQGISPDGTIQVTCNYTNLLFPVINPLKAKHGL